MLPPGFLRSEDAPDGRHQPAPLAGLRSELPASLAGKRVETRLPIVLADAPLGLDPALIFEPLQSRIKRPMVDQQRILRSMPDGAGDPLPMLRPEHQRPQNQQVERPL